jgi:hypothetical protein
MDVHARNPWTYSNPQVSTCSLCNTACALLKQAPPSERKAFAREYGLNCDSI